MRKLSVFNNVLLDGDFTDAKGNVGWTHKQDPEWRDFADSIVDTAYSVVDWAQLSRRRGAYFLPMNLSDVWRAALDLKKQYSAGAASAASERAERCFASGDIEGFRAWNRVQHAIIEIDREPDPREIVH